MNLGFRWLRLWQAFGLYGNAHRWFSQLSSLYREEHRHYHTLAHIEHGLTVLDSVKHLAQDPLLLEFAWWFHDAYYDPTRHDNEVRSADLATSLLPSEKVRSLIMATLHDVVPEDSDAQLLIDIDLSILGADEHVFDEYERNIRKEYAFVPEDAFRQGRADLLRRFLKRKYIFNTQTMRDRYEAKAGANLTRSIAALRG